jgi:cell division protein ZapD
MNDIIYEQPVNELIRVFLRLEQLFQKIDRELEQASDQRCVELIQTLVNTLNILDRPDLKSKITQELHRYISVFNRLTQSPDISQDTLKTTLTELNALLHYFSSLQGKMGQPLREKEFFSILRLKCNTPAAECSFDTPAYFCWLQQPYDSRLQQIKHWATAFDETKQVVRLLLKMIRHSAEPTNKNAEQGFYFESLNTQVPTQLIRVSVDASLKLYPEISVGKHRLNIRFYVPDVDRRAKQAAETVPFGLTVCTI